MQPLAESQYDYNFKTAQIDFHKLKEENSLPFKMLIKLQYLENKILSLKINKEEYKELPEYELESLEQCDKQSQMTLFSSIVKCLSGKEVIVYFKDEKAYIKKEESFSMWTKCYISCDSTFLYIKKKVSKKTNYYEFRIRQLKVSKKYLEYKGRLCFGLMYEHKKYMLGFEQETACERIFKTLKQLVKENHPEYENINDDSRMKEIRSEQQQKLILPSNTQNNNQSEKFESVLVMGDKLSHNGNNVMKLSFHTCQQENNNGNVFFDSNFHETNKNSSEVSGIMEFEQEELTQEQELSLDKKREEQLTNLIKEEIKKETQQTNNDSLFKLIKNIEIGRILIDNQYERQTSKEVKTKTSIILTLENNNNNNNELIDLSWILEQYIHMQSWNMEVEESRIINKISENSYKLFVQFKKYSIMSLARWCIVTVTCIKIEKKVYLLIRSCEELTEEELQLGNYMSTVRMKKFHQTIELTQRIEQPEKILMIVLTIVDYGGYCSKQDNLSMVLQFLININNFHHYLITQFIAYGSDAHSHDYESSEEQSTKNSRLFIIIKEQHENKNNSNMTKQKSKFLDLDESLNSISQSQHTNRKKSESIGSEVSYDEEDSGVFIPSEQKINKYHPQSNQQIITFEKEQEFPKPSPYRSFNKDTQSHHHQELQLSQYSHNAETILFNEFIKEFSTFQQTEKGTEKLVEFILSKVQEKHYLKHRFKELETFNPNAPKYNQDPNSDNWLLQNGRWKISGIELIFTNEEILAKQKNVIKFILKQLSSNVMSGKNIMNMSLPVEIFEDKSFLEKLGIVYGLFPYYFNLAAKEKNIVKQITYVSQAFAFATTIQPNIEKPFNPILGETYQCTIGGVSLYFEQISHHPPISAFYIKTDEYEAYGAHNPNVDMGLNTAIAKNLHPITVHFFETNTKYIGYGQDFEIGGLMFGQRSYKNSGKLNVFEEKNEILCELSYGKNKKHIYESQKKIKTGDIIGGVYKVSNAFTRRFKHAQWKNFDGIKYDEKIEELAKIHGNWMGDFYMDGIKLRGMYDVVPFKPVKEVYVLPSDCSFRLDVYYKKMNDMKKSQEWKEVMENMQRKDRKLREEYTGIKSH